MNILKSLKLLSILLSILFFVISCAGKHPIEEFAEQQHSKVFEQNVYVQADFDFYAAAYMPSHTELQTLRESWVKHGQAFPESKAIAEIERELNQPAQRVLLIGLFRTDYEKADLKDKSLGWALYPEPLSISELSESDVVLRTLMPVANRWARYFLVRINPRVWENSGRRVIISNRSNKIEFKLQ